MERPLWVFGYGSLIWNPGFVFADRQRATLSGWRRSFCMHSVQYRGTPEAPGLVLALDAEDRALLQQVPDEQAAATLQAPLGDARAASRVMQEEKLGPFHEATSSADCDPGLLTRGRGWYDEENGGAWMAADAFLAVPGCPCKLSMDIYLPEDFPERVVTFATPDGRHEDVYVRPGVSTNVAVDLPLQKGLLSLRTNGTSQPAQLGQSADTRELGVWVGPRGVLSGSDAATQQASPGALAD